MGFVVVLLPQFPGAVKLRRRQVHERICACIGRSQDRVDESLGRRRADGRVQGTCLARLFSSCTVFTTMTVAEKDLVFRHFLGTIEIQE
jgi:hypothetical protein